MPLTTEQYQKSLAQPPLCEQLKVRDLTDDLLIQLNGSFVAGYRVSGIHSYYASDEDRNRTKLVLEALIRSLPERSMRLQVRFEIAEGAEDLIARYNREQQNPSAVLQAVDREQSDALAEEKRRGLLPAAHAALLLHLGPAHPSPVAGVGVEKEDARLELQHVGQQMHRAQPAGA